MARVVKLVSDITGTEADESQFVKCVVRSHPKIEEAKSLDILPGELDGLKGLYKAVENMKPPVTSRRPFGEI